MNILLLLALSSCPAPRLIDRSGIGWTDPLGSATLQRATEVCATRYKGCLVRLERVEERAFRAICKRQATDPSK